MWEPLIYDKSIGTDRNLSNDKIIKILIEDIYTDDNNYISHNMNDSIKLFNNDICNTSIKHLMLNTKLDKELYDVKYFIQEESNIKVLLVLVNCTKLEYYVSNDIDIPNFSFLETLCKTHSLYMKYIEYSKLLANTTKTNDFLDFVLDKNTTSQIGKVVGEIMNKNSNIQMNSYIEDPIDPVEKYLLLTTKLFDYQKYSIGWMTSKEKNMKDNTINFNMNDEVILGNVYYDLFYHKLYHISHRNKITFYGGGVIDEVGLGKTLQVITLSLLNQPTDISYFRNDSTYLHSKATLILCPNTLCGQWKREIISMISTKYNVVVLPLLSKRDFDKYTYQDLLDADFVLVSFTLLQQPLLARSIIIIISTAGGEPASGC